MARRGYRLGNLPKRHPTRAVQTPKKPGKTGRAAAENWVGNRQVKRPRKSAFNRESARTALSCCVSSAVSAMGVPATDVIETPALEPPWLGIRRLAQRKASCAAALP